MIGVGGVLHFFDQALQPILEFALYARTGLEQSQVERADMHVLQRRRNIALRHAESEAFHHGRLAHARFAGQDRVVLTAARENIDDLADLRVAAEHRIDLAFLGITGEIDRVLVEVRRLSAIGFAPSAGAEAAPENPVDVVSAESATIPIRSLRRASDIDLLKFLAHVAHQARKFLIRREREDGESGAHLTCVEVDGADGPRNGQHLQHCRTDGRRAGISRLEFVEASRQLSRQARLVDLEMLDDRGKVIVGRVEELGEKVLDLDVVVGAGQAKACCSFQSAARLVIQLCNQRLQIQSHVTLTMQESCRLDRVHIDFVLAHAVHPSLAGASASDSS